MTRVTGEVLRTEPALTPDSEREIFGNQPEITILTVIFSVQ